MLILGVWGKSGEVPCDVGGTTALTLLVGVLGGRLEMREDRIQWVVNPATAVGEVFFAAVLIRNL